MPKVPARRMVLVTFTTLAMVLSITPSSPSAEKEETVASKQRALLRKMDVEEAWKTTRGDPKVLVGVLDNGFDFYHPDLKGQLVPGYYYPGGFHAEFYENMAHGTFVSSLIVARGDRPGAMSGLAPGCRALTASQGMIEHTLVKLQTAYFREHPKATLADFQGEMVKHLDEVAAFGRAWVLYQVLGAADGIRYLVDHGVRVINISGAMTRSLCPSTEAWEKLEAAFTHAADRDVVIVLAAGNNAAQWDDYPGDDRTVIIAGASRLDDTRWEEQIAVQGMKLKQGSNFGKRLTAMAPVDNLLVCVPHEKRFYESDDGPMGATKVPFQGPHEVRPIGATSLAAPMVTALVALVRSARPDLDVKTVVELIKEGCDDIGEPGPDLLTGHGRIHFGKTLRLARERKPR